MEQQSDPLDEVKPVSKSNSYQPPINQSGIMPLIKMAIPAALVLLLVLYQSGSYVNVKNYAADMRGLNSQISSVSNVTAYIPQINTSLAGITGLINNINTDITSIKSREPSYVTTDRLTAMGTSITQIQNDLTTTKNSVAGINVKSLQDSITSIQSQLGNYISTTTFGASMTQIQTDLTSLKNSVASINVKSLQDSITALQNQVATDTKTIQELQAKVNALATPNVTANGTGNVTVTLINNTWTGQPPVMGFLVGANTTISQQFTFQINNGLNRQINNVQLAIGLQLVDPTTYQFIALPTNASVAVSEPGVIWQSQGQIMAGLWGFTNTAPTGVFGGIGVINQAPGATTYTVTVTVANSSNTTLPSFNVYPIVKIVSYN